MRSSENLSQAVADCERRFTATNYSENILPENGTVVSSFPRLFEEVGLSEVSGYGETNTILATKDCEQYSPDESSNSFIPRSLSDMSMIIDGCETSSSSVSKYSVNSQPKCSTPCFSAIFAEASKALAYVNTSDILPAEVSEQPSPYQSGIPFMPNISSEISMEVDNAIISSTPNNSEDISRVQEAPNLSEFVEPQEQLIHNENQPSSVNNESPIGLTASFDGGWQKRGTGRTYDSLTGHASLIGYHSKKILSFATRQKRCAKCQAGHKPSDHDCRLNFHGSAKAMEPDMAVEVVTKNPLLEASNCRIDNLIGDDDSSTIAAVRRHANHYIEKWSDVNHCSRSLSNAMYEIRPKVPTYVIDYLTYLFGSAVKHHKDDVEGVRHALSCIVPHGFDDHAKCGNWCKASDPDYNHQYLPNGKGLTGENLRKSLDCVFLKFINIAERLAPCGSSQANETWNHTVASKLPKDRSYGRSESSCYKVAAAVCMKNKGRKYVVDVNEELGLSPGGLTKKFLEKKDAERLAMSLKAKTSLFKRNRLTGRKLRQANRSQ